MDHVIGELCYKGTTLQRNCRVSEACYKGAFLERYYRKMTISWSFSYSSFVKFHDRKKLETQ